jgi:hypothetical protein
VDEEWFATDDEDELDEVQQAVVSVLRARACAAPWPIDPTDACLTLPGWVSYPYELTPEENSYGRLVAYTDIVDVEQNCILITVGAHFDGSSVRGDELHNQLFTLPDKPTSLALAAVGSSEEIADRTADWFETLLRRPIVRHEWLRSGGIYARRWLFADTGQGLVEGRVRTGELGAPDRVVHVRGNV